jgi:hypothetical protein
LPFCFGPSAKFVGIKSDLNELIDCLLISGRTRCLLQLYARPKTNNPRSPPSLAPAYLSPSIPLSALPTAAASCCTPAPPPNSPPPSDSRCLRQDLAAGVEDLRPVLVVAVRSGWRWAPPVLPRRLQRTIWDFGAPPTGPSLPRCTSRGRRPKEEEQQWTALEDLLHGTKTSASPHHNCKLPIPSPLPVQISDFYHLAHGFAMFSQITTELMLPPTDAPLFGACQGALRSPSPFRVSTSSAPSHGHGVLIF